MKTAPTDQKTAIKERNQRLFRGDISEKRAPSTGRLPPTPNPNKNKNIMSDQKLGAQAEAKPPADAIARVQVKEGFLPIRSLQTQRPHSSCQENRQHRGENSKEQEQLQSSKNKGKEHGKRREERRRQKARIQECNEKRRKTRRQNDKENAQHEEDGAT